MEVKDKEITFKIDGREVKSKEETTILEAAKEAGVDIPTLCYCHALSPFGACRLCSVEITDKRGRKRIVTSCNYPVEEGLTVDTKSEKVMKTRKMLLELLIARCPKVKKIQDLAREYDIRQPRLWVEDEEEDCILCGLCARVCEELVGVSAINFANRGVQREVTAPYHTLSDDCIGCGACARVCPTGSKKIRMNTYPMLEEDKRKVEDGFLKGTRDEYLGVHNEILAAKSPIKGQDGGMATALLISGMQRGIFDAAIVVQRKDGYRAQAIIAENIDEIMNARGTKYQRVKMISKFLELIEKGKRKIAIVGTPCEVRAIREIQQTFLRDLPPVEITVLGLFCYEAFIYEKLREETRKLLGVDLDKSEKTQIHKGKFIMQVDGKEYSCRVRDLGKAVEKGCAFCDDFVSRLADVSIGSVGSPDGYSTVIVRSDVGKNLLDGLDFVKGDVNKEEIIKLSALKKQNAEKNFAPLLPTAQK
ncbi:MAG TPA: Coenzyme F420 hydrogenase/dehydrogenase, beta subunit C-terminal domain [candidate division Zixibacteria bacterium]|nr:Coenzyme F420 hydrogenase/dehydrogenase, beta subunit C-terminal domain [candidate division Zixibacteria bacterium]